MFPSRNCFRKMRTFDDCMETVMYHTSTEHSNGLIQVNYSANKNQPKLITIDELDNERLICDTDRLEFRNGSL